MKKPIVDCQEIGEENLEALKTNPAPGPLTLKVMEKCERAADMPPH